MSAVQQALIGTVGLAFVFNQTISTNQTNYNLRAAAVAAGWNQLTPLIATVTVNSGVYVSSNSTGTPAFDTGVTFPAGSLLSLNCSGAFIVGMGGAGGTGGGSPPLGWPATAGSGSNGGLALRAQHAISINNSGGTIGGGGGGGGGGGHEIFSDGKNPQTFPYGGGGGGGGRTGTTNSPGGGGGGSYMGNGATGGAGTLSAAGSGGNGGGGETHRGGNGGAWGAAGAGGVGGNGGSSPGPGGSGGAAVSGNSNITWINTGTRLGAIT